MEVWLRHHNFFGIFRNFFAFFFAIFLQLDWTLADRNPPPPLRHSVPGAQCPAKLSSFALCHKQAADANDPLFTSIDGLQEALACLGDISLNDGVELAKVWPRLVLVVVLLI